MPEEDLVRSLADNNWRLRKITSLERTLLTRLETVEPEAFEDTLKELRRTSTYAHRTQRTIEKIRAELANDAIRAGSRPTTKPNKRRSYSHS